MREYRWNLASLTVGLVIGAFAVTCTQARPGNDGTSSFGSAVDAVARGLSPAPAFARADAQGVTIADVAEGAVPSVVNISATRSSEAGGRSPLLEDPFFREFFGPFPRDREQQSLGSGVIVSKEGVILTNNHVIDRAEEVRVTLSDGREFNAEVAGTDPQSDLAVIRLKEKVDGLRPLPFGDSSQLRLGEVVLAIGNPFGVGQTVTMGIVSATGRNRVGIVDYEDFIQTDAAINPGNSGGALINMRGELIGVNTAILSRTGGYQGIGFAIPADMARPIMQSLLDHGKVVRGWLGVVIQDLDRDLAAGLGLSVTRGVVISDVASDSPAARAGLKRGDVVLEVNGRKINSSALFRNLIASAGPDSEVGITILRDGKQSKVTAKLGSLADSPDAPAAVREEGALSGLSVTNLNAQTRARYQIPGRIQHGVVVTGVEPRSRASAMGLRQGDVILEVNRQRVQSSAQFRELHGKAADSMLLLIYRNGSTIYLSIRK